MVFGAFSACYQRQAFVETIVVDFAIGRIKVLAFHGHVWLAVVPTALLTDLDVVVMEMGAGQLGLVLLEGSPNR